MISSLGLGVYVYGRESRKASEVGVSPWFGIGGNLGFLGRERLDKTFQVRLCKI